MTAWSPVTIAAGRNRRARLVPRLHHDAERLVVPVAADRDEGIAERLGGLLLDPVERQEQALLGELLREPRAGEDRQVGERLLRSRRAYALFELVPLRHVDDIRAGERAPVSLQNGLERLLLAPLPGAPDLHRSGVDRLLREPLVLVLARRIVLEEPRSEQDGQEHDQRERGQEQEESASPHRDPRP